MINKKYIEKVKYYKNIFISKYKNILSGIKMYFNKYRTIRKELLILLCIAILSILLNDLWLIREREISRITTVLGNLYYKICLSYVSAFIFFIVNIHVQAHKTKVKLYRYINNKILMIARHGKSLMKTVLRESGNKLGVNDDVPQISKDEFKIYCEKVNPKNPVVYKNFIPIVFNNWYDCFDFIHRTTRESMTDLLIIKDALDPEILRLLTNIEDCFENHINITKGTVLANETLESQSYEIYNFANYCNQLSKYIDTKYKKYEDEYHYLFRKGKIN